MVSFVHKHFILAPPLVLLGGGCTSGGLSRRSLAVRECQFKKCPTEAQRSEMSPEVPQVPNRVWPVGEQGIQRRDDEYYDFSSFQTFDELTECMTRCMFLEMCFMQSPNFFKPAGQFDFWYIGMILSIKNITDIVFLPKLNSPITCQALVISTSTTILLH